jgi:hypothetical protein
VNRWQFPEKDITLENDKVRISGVELAKDLESLYSAASLDQNKEDLFSFHVNVPPMTKIEAFEKYLLGKMSDPSEQIYKIYSKRLNRDVGCALF